MGCRLGTRCYYFVTCIYRSQSAQGAFIPTTVEMKGYQGIAQARNTQVCFSLPRHFRFSTKLSLGHGFHGSPLSSLSNPSLNCPRGLRIDSVCWLAPESFQHFEVEVSLPPHSLQLPLYSDELQVPEVPNSTNLFICVPDCSDIQTLVKRTKRCVTLLESRATSPEITKVPRIW